MVVRSVYKEGGKVFLIETKGQTPLFGDFQNQSPQRGKLFFYMKGGKQEEAERVRAVIHMEK